MTTNEKALLLHEEWNGKIETVSKSPVKWKSLNALIFVRSTLPSTTSEVL